MKVLWIAAFLALSASAAGCGKDPSPVDADGDGFFADVDCDDGDAAVNPDAIEVCDGVDNDCADEADGPDASDAGAWFVDSDGDGFGDPDRLAKACDRPPGWSADGTDCDDDDATVLGGCG